MSANSHQPPEDQLLCSICLDVFLHPVTTSCGHNFCKKCITQYWDVNSKYLCPMCKTGFRKRPQLKVNTVISDLVAQFTHEPQRRTWKALLHKCFKRFSLWQLKVGTGTKLVALVSCLVCLWFYCETHLEPRLTISGLLRHLLPEPVENLENRMCMKHNKLLELFCKTDQTCVCALCSKSDHRNHNVVPLREEYEGKKAELGKTEAEIQQMIQKRRLKSREIKESVKMSNDAADREKAEGAQVFTALMEAVDGGLKELIKDIKDEQETTEKQAEGLIKALEQEISELMERSSEVEQLSHSEDHLHLLQSFSSMKAAPPTKCWTEVRVRTPSYEGTVVKAVAQLEKTVWEHRQKLMDAARLKMLQQYAVDVTVDPETAHPYLILSDDRKEVRDSHVWKKRPDNPERFTNYLMVLGEQSFSSGRFYFEVQVKGKTEWTLGVARESVDRKGALTLSPDDGFWTVWLRKGNEYEALDAPPVRLSLQPGPEKVGVFVDYEEGLVSFYDVDAAALICSFTGCSFMEKLLPFFSPGNTDGGKNSAPLIICPVSKTA